MALPGIDNIEQQKMRKVLFYVFLAIFVVLTILTTLSLFFGLTKLKEKYETTLVTTFVIEAGAAIIAIFYGLFGIKRKEATASISANIRIYISAVENGFERNATYSAYYEITDEDTYEKRKNEKVETKWTAGNFLWFSIKEIAENEIIKFGIKDVNGKRWESDSFSPRENRFGKLNPL